MTRAEILEAASSKLTEAAILLLVAGEDHLATEVEEIMELADFSPAFSFTREPIRSAPRGPRPQGIAEKGR